LPAPATEVPPIVVTATLTIVPAVPAGATAVICESESARKVVASTVPNFTDRGKASPLPKTFTTCPPVEFPWSGFKPETAGVGSHRSAASVVAAAPFTASCAKPTVSSVLGAARAMSKRAW